MPFPQRLKLAHLPTPLWSNPALNAWLGLELWVKRDDMSSGAAAGNKIRKLEFLLYQAMADGCRHVITCGGEQSNHARTTALCAAELGLGCTLYLRSKDPDQARGGNLLLNRLAGAEIRWLSPEQYHNVTSIMHEAQDSDRRDGKQSAVIVEGGSSGLGAFGYFSAMLEIRDQLARGAAAGHQTFEAVVHACGSGGTAAGVALGATATGIASRVISVPVCDDAAFFEAKVGSLCRHARELCPELSPPMPIEFPEGFQGPGYGIASPDQWRFFSQVARLSGLVLDPVYSGKALFALQQLPHKPRSALFIHTGGLPGLLAQQPPSEFSAG